MNHSSFLYAASCGREKLSWHFLLGPLGQNKDGDSGGLGFISHDLSCA